jgi:hypothetical protein
MWFWFACRQVYLLLGRKIDYQRIMVANEYLLNTLAITTTFSVGEARRTHVQLLSLLLPDTDNL